MAKAASPRTTTASKSDRRQSQNMQECKIILLDGEVVEVPVDRRVKAADLIERAHSEVDVAEKDFFSLFFLENNQKVFLDPLRPIKDQLPSTMKNAWCLNYGVKYYISDPSFLQEDISRYLFCLQLCRDIKENRVFIDRETAARLTALMLQATLGDYDPSEHKAGFINAFKDFILIPLDDLPENYEQKLTTLMQVKQGYSPAQAEAEFLQISKTLPRYGMQLFAARQATSEGGKKVLIGLSHRGISLIEGHNEEYETFPWTNIAKISYKRYTFVIRYREGGEDEASNKKAKVRVMKLYCGLPPHSKRIWKAAVEQHTFFRLHAPERVSRLQSVFRRGTKFRFSGRTFQQVKNSAVSRDAPKFARTYSERLHRNPRKEFAPGFVAARNSFRSRKVVNKQFVIGKEDVHDREWMILSAPPVDDSPMLDSAALEENNVHVRVRVKDGLPETTHRFRLVQKDGKYQLEEIVVVEKEEEEERLDNTAPMMNGSNPSGRKVSVGLNQSFEEEPRSKILMKLPPIMSAEEEAASQVGKFLLREERLMAAAIAAEDREKGGSKVSATE